MKPDLLILGDSHTLALRDGAQQLGLTTDGLWFSGGNWHQGMFSFGKRGFQPHRMPSVTRQLEELRARMGVDQPFATGIPVIACYGYHLGRLVPPFGLGMFRLADHAGQYQDDAPSVSRDFLADYIRHFRERHLQLARRMSRSNPTIFVAPPIAHTRPNYVAFQTLITAMLRGVGAQVFDPAEEMVDAGRGTVDPALLMDDENHGTADFGAEVIGRLIARGVLAAPGAGAAKTQS